MSDEENSKLVELVAIAVKEGMFPLLKRGYTPFYAADDYGSRSVDHDRAHVKHHHPDHPDQTRGSGDTLRLSGNGGRVVRKVCNM